MTNYIFKLLKNYSTDPQCIDRLIISSFLRSNKVAVVHNLFLREYIISEEDIEEFNTLQEFEDILRKERHIYDIELLIELFEFVISPADRIINGAIYTPLHIRNYIIDQSFSSKEGILDTINVADISCGCGGFLYDAAKLIKKKTNRSYAEIFNNQIFGLDIQNYSIVRTKLLLSVLAIVEGEDVPCFNFNLFQGDALTFKWNNHLERFNGFDIIVGNPPYVCAKNLSNSVKDNLKNWTVCKSGNPDLYIPFFQIGIENLANNGVLGYITMNSFFKSLNGRSLRDYFHINSLKINIVDFGTEQIFRSKSTYTCICMIENSQQDFISYYKSDNKTLPKVERDFNRVYYQDLDPRKGWNLHDNHIISKIESIGKPFGDLYRTRHGIATLRNDIFIFKPVSEDADYYYLTSMENTYPIEKGICRDIVNSNKLSRAIIDISELIEKVIFPYDNTESPKLLNENIFQNKYPQAYKYLNEKKHLLAQRDKGKGKYENWYAFGRTQSLEKIKNKMFFPKYSDKTPCFLMSNDENLLFYNGQAIVGHNAEEMEVVKKIMESSVFWYYIKCTSKPYSSNYYSLNGLYIRNFGICDLNDKEKELILKESNPKKLDSFFNEKYGIKI